MATARCRPRAGSMAESWIAQRIAARRAELDELEEQLAEQLEEVRGERP
ncbi:hypothetical protein ACFYZJ_29390 [Streptomyces sp. NPDC001848]